MTFDRKIFLPFSILVVFIFTLLFLAHQNKKMTVVLDGKSFNVEIADTYLTRERGLSGHKPLLDNEGMIFIFETPADYSFWMKEMLFPLDIIWIDQNLKIIHIEKSLTPESYPKSFSPSSPALYVLEVPAGQSEKLGLKARDSVQFVKK